MRRLKATFFMAMLLTIPAILMPQKPCMGEYKYYSKGRRDPLIPLILSQTRASLGLQAVETVEDVTLEGIIYDPFGSSIAMINGEIIKEGEKINNVEMVKIRSNSVTVKIYDGTHTISLVEEGGE